MAFIILRLKEWGIRLENFVGHVQIIKEFCQICNTCLMTPFM